MTALNLLYPWVRQKTFKQKNEVARTSALKKHPEINPLRSYQQRRHRRFPPQALQPSRNNGRNMARGAKAQSPLTRGQGNGITTAIKRPIKQLCH